MIYTETDQLKWANYSNYLHSFTLDGEYWKSITKYEKNMYLDNIIGLLSIIPRKNVYFDKIASMMCTNNGEDRQVQK